MVSLFCSVCSVVPEDVAGEVLNITEPPRPFPVPLPALIVKSLPMVSIAVGYPDGAKKFILLK